MSIIQRLEQLERARQAQEARRIAALGRLLGALSPEEAIVGWLDVWTGICVVEAADYPQKGRLSAPRGTHDADDLAPVTSKVIPARAGQGSPSPLNVFRIPTTESTGSSIIPSPPS